MIANAFFFVYASVGVVILGYFSLEAWFAPELSTKILNSTLGLLYSIFWVVIVSALITWVIVEICLDSYKRSRHSRNS